MVGIIYKLETEYGNYIGSTFRDIDIRIREHISDMRYEKKCSSAKILKDAVNIQYEILECLNTTDKYELKNKECEYIINTPGCINVYRPYDNISHLARYQKVRCPDCNGEFAKKSLWKHKKRKHTPVNI
jgi:hypothetical protein